VIFDPDQQDVDGRLLGAKGKELTRDEFYFNVWSF
jgi:hypothetical protein